MVNRWHWPEEDRRMKLTRIGAHKCASGGFVFAEEAAAIALTMPVTFLAVAVAIEVC